MPSISATTPTSASRREWLTTALGVLFLLGTQFYISIPSPASVSGTKSLAVGEVLGLAFGAYALWLYAHRANRERIGRLGHYLVGASVVMTVVWAAMVILRGALDHRKSFSVTMIEFLLIAVAIALLVLMRAVSPRTIYLTVLVTFAVLHAWLLARIILGGRIRAVGLLGNINVYIGLVLLSLPVVLYWCRREPVRWLRWTILGNVAFAIATVAVSGSRFGGPGMIASLTLFMLFIDDRPWRERLRWLAVLLISSIIITGLFMARNTRHITDFGRTLNLQSVIHGTEPDTEEIEQEQAGKDKPPPPPNEHDKLSTPGDPDHDLPPKEGLNILNHTRVQARTIAVIKEHPFLGIGRPGPYFSGWGYHPAHNIAFEALLNFGAPGVVPYFAVALAGAGALGLRRSWTRPSRAYLLGFAGLLGFSFFQPLMSESLICLSISWGLFAMTWMWRHDRTDVEQRLTEVRP